MTVALSGVGVDGVDGDSVILPLIGGTASMSAPGSSDLAFLVLS